VYVRTINFDLAEGCVYSSPALEECCFLQERL